MAANKTLFSVGEQLTTLLNQTSTGQQQYEVLNFGVNGYNSVQELGVLRHYALSYQPDVIVVILHSILKITKSHSPLEPNRLLYLNSSENKM